VEAVEGVRGIETMELLRHGRQARSCFRGRAEIRTVLDFVRNGPLAFILAVDRCPRTAIRAIAEKFLI
jgi:hypothetical protein